MSKNDNANTENTKTYSLYTSCLYSVLV